MPFYIQHRKTKEYLRKKKFTRSPIEWATSKPRYFTHKGAMFLALEGFLIQYHWKRYEDKDSYRSGYVLGEPCYAINRWWSQFKAGKHIEDLIPTDWQVKELKLPSLEDDDA